MTGLDRSPVHHGGSSRAGVVAGTPSDAFGATAAFSAMEQPRTFALPRELPHGYLRYPSFSPDAPVAGAAS